MEDNYTSAFAKRIEDCLKAVGLQHAELTSSTPDSSNFGNADASCRLGPLILRFIRDRGQEFLDIASSARTDQFFPFDDIDIAMGWKTVEEVVSRREPESLEGVLARLSKHAQELTDAFSGERERLTRARIERATRDRGRAFVDRLRGKD